MIETHELILILIVYTAILLLVIFYIYPCLKRLLKRKISISIQINAGYKGGKVKEMQPERKEEFPSVLGKTKFVLSQPLPNTATDSGTENRKEKEDTFAPETQNPKVKTVDYETGEGIEIPEENEDVSDLDLNQEDEDIGMKSMPEEASGIDFNDMGKTARTVSNPEGSSGQDEELAGKVLSENKYTGLVKSMQDVRPEYARRITELMDRHEQKLAERQNRGIRTSPRKQKMYESEDYKNFNIDEIS
ncbi:hypothetical protein JGH11_01590 [Dysgonomonas sp. Marseille-P4677]|uniref:hypothetical protein n=1 Tax=Dysgonomonas sp. Marseille-P4677 TaxID=2364790 RepID=UPI001912C779|nr:hypothetical protein [Dysgonomonas sp. Marseille-P4677]MBK5719556.1 hypothetical protein [Dysgonomonas sp. Marseille-P4677]